MVNTKAAGSEPQAQAAEEMPTLAIGVAVVLVFPVECLHHGVTLPINGLMTNAHRGVEVPGQRMGAMMS
jgi:hypothetical protein